MLVVRWPRRKRSRRLGNHAAPNHYPRGNRTATVSELAIEAFYPANAHTAMRLLRDVAGA